jgi:hypothetical protein
MLSYPRRPYLTSTLKLEAVCSSEMVVSTYEIVRCHSPENHNLYIYTLVILTCSSTTTPIGSAAVLWVDLPHITHWYFGILAKNVGRCSSPRSISAKTSSSARHKCAPQKAHTVITWEVTHNNKKCLFLSQDVRFSCRCIIFSLLVI